MYLNSLYIYRQFWESNTCTYIYMQYLNYLLSVFINVSLLLYNCNPFKKLHVNVNNKKNKC